MMTIDFDNPKHEAIVNNYQALCKKYNKKSTNVADEILAALEVLKSADSLAEVPRSYHPHPLHGEYKGCFAINVTNTHRIIFRPNHNGDPNFRIDSYKSITSISVIEIFKDYHY